MRLSTGARRAGLDGADLLHGSILIVCALDEERRNAPAVDLVFDVPGLEAGVEPGVVPAAKGAIDMGVVFGELGAEIAGLVGAAAPPRSRLGPSLQ